MLNNLTAYFTAYPDITWMVLGGILLFVEASLFPGMGMLFAGLGALSLGGLMAFSLIEHPHFYGQLAWFLGLTTGWAVLLWKPLKKTRKGKGKKKGKDEGYNNYIGTTAMVASAVLTKEQVGEVRWSGTNIKARLSDEAFCDSVSAGEEVRVVRMEKSVMIVEPTSIPMPTEDELATYRELSTDDNGKDSEDRKREREREKAIAEYHKKDSDF